MKKTISVLLAVLLGLLIPLTASAAEDLTSCEVSVDVGDAVIFGPGETIEVEIKIDKNPGFTNFAVALDYDRDALTLKEIATKETTPEGENPYLCGLQVSANTRWSDGDKTYGYVVAAMVEPEKAESGTLFKATFEIAADYVGEAVIKPEVLYIRNNERLFSVFEDINAKVTAAKIKSVLPGDVNLDGIVEYDDVMLAYRASNGTAELDNEQLAAADRNKNGNVDESDYREIYDIYVGRVHK